MPDSRQPNFSPVTHSTEQSLEEGEPEQEDEEDEDDTKYVPMQATTLDGVVLAMACAHDANYRTEDYCVVVFRLTMTLLLSLLSFSLQVGVLWLFFTTTLEYKEDPYEPAQLEPMQAVLRDSLMAEPPIRLNETIKLERDTLKLCSADKTMKGSHQLMIFIWLVRIAQEFDDIFKRSKNILRALPAKAVDHVLVRVDGDKHEIMAMTSTLKVCCILFVVLPQLCVALFVAYVGVKYLAMSNDMASLIFKCVSLQFIVGLDEHVFKTFSPSYFMKMLKSSQIHIKVLWRKHTMPCEGWAWTLFRVMVLVVISVGVYDLPWHPTLAFKKTCAAYFKHFPASAVCKTCGWTSHDVPAFLQPFFNASKRE